MAGKVVEWRRENGGVVIGWRHLEQDELEMWDQLSRLQVHIDIERYTGFTTMGTMAVITHIDSWFDTNAGVLVSRNANITFRFV